MTAPSSSSGTPNQAAARRPASGKPHTPKRTPPKTTLEKTTGKHPGGRPTKYKPEYCQQIIDYMAQETSHQEEIVHTNTKGVKWTEYKERPNPIRFVTAFARKIGVTMMTLAEWCKVHPEFSEAYARARDMQSEHLLQCGFLGLSDPAMTKFAAVNLTDLKDKTDQTVSAELTIVPSITITPPKDP